MKTEAVRRSGKGSAEAASTRPMHGTDTSVSVTVVYAQRDDVWQAALAVPVGTTVGQVLRLSGFAQAFPDYPVDEPALGIFGRRCQQDQIVSDADRIEIYRPLSFDPMESRRRRVEHRRATEEKSPFRPRRVHDAP